MNPPARRGQDYLTSHPEPQDAVADRIGELMTSGMSEAEAREFIASGQDVRHEVPEHITISVRTDRRDHRVYWSAVWWHASELGHRGMDMIIEQSGEIESERPDQAIAWAMSRCANIRIFSPTGEYIPLEQYLNDNRP